MRTDLDIAMGTVPPSPIDVDQLIRSGRRRALVRRCGIAGAGGAVVAAIAVTVAISLGAGSGSVSVGGPPSASPDPARSSASALPSASPDGLTATPDGLARETETRLTEAALAVVREHAPGFTLAAGPDGQPFAMRYLFHEKTADNRGTSTYYGSADLRGKTSSGNVAINVGRKGPLWDPFWRCLPEGTMDCQITTEADGTRVSVHPVGEHTNRAVVERPDGTVVIVDAANQGGQTDTGASRQIDPVLTLEQVLAIARDPRLHC